MNRYFKSLENADKQTAERIARRYPALSHKEKSVIYREIRARRSTTSNFVSEEQVHGVERYCRPMWHTPLRITVAVLALVLGLGGTVYAVLGFGGAVLPAVSIPEDKLSQSEPVDDVTTATEAFTEPDYIELTEDDFTNVDIMCEITDGMPSAVHCIELEGIDFGERVSLCKEQDASAFKGQVESAVYLDEKLFFGVNFDDYCMQHDSSVFRYDPVTKEIKELARPEELEYKGSFSTLYSVHGKLLFIDTSKSDITSYSICEIDTESGDISELITIDNPIYRILESADGLLIGSYDGGDSIKYLQEYVFATKELRVFDNKNVINSNGTIYCDGIPAEITGGFDGEKNFPITVKTQYYSISTNINNYSDIFLWRDKICIVPADTFNGSWLYTYDIAKRECLKMKFDGFNHNLIKTNDALVYLSDSVGGGDPYTTLYYIEPTLGTVFRVGKEDGIAMSGGSEDDAFVITVKSADGKKLNDSSNGIIYYGNGRKMQPTVPDKLFTFDE